MRKIACLSVPFVLSPYHLNAARNTLQSIKSSTCSGNITTFGIANVVRMKDSTEEDLKKLYDHFVMNDKNILARAWNRGIRDAQASGATHILIHNLDIVLHSETIERLANAVDSYDQYTIFSPRMWWNKATLQDAKLEKGIEAGGHMCCFMVRPDFLDVMGEFDELFTPAYQEDADMFYRMRLMGRSGAFVKDAFMYHTEGGTLRGCLTQENTPGIDKVTVASAILTKIKENDVRYIEKWGGPLGSELYKTPFNKPLPIAGTLQGEYR